MAVKTITIDTEAYSRLKRLKKTNESFSQTLKRVLPRTQTVKEWLKEIARKPASPEFIKAVEKQISERRAPHNQVGRRGLP